MRVSFRMDGLRSGELQRKGTGIKLSGSRWYGCWCPRKVELDKRQIARNWLEFVEMYIIPCSQAPWGPGNFGDL